MTNLESTIKTKKYDTTIYTLTHPTSRNQVKIIGISHFGTEEYYETVMRSANSSDIVVYEAITRQSGMNSLTDYFFFLNYLRFTALEESLCDVLNTHNRLQVTRSLRDNSNLETSELEINQLLEPIYAFSQKSQLPYHNLPDNWYLGDPSIEEIKQEFGIFSPLNCEALIHLVMRKVSSSWSNTSVRANEREHDQINGRKKRRNYLQRIRAYCENILVNQVGNMSVVFDLYYDDFFNNPSSIKTFSAIDIMRESRVIEVLIDRIIDPDINSVSILYSMGHIKHIYNKLINQGYQEENTQHITALHIVQPT